MIMPVSMCVHAQAHVCVSGRFNEEVGVQATSKKKNLVNN